MPPVRTNKHTVSPVETSPSPLAYVSNSPFAAGASSTPPLQLSSLPFTSPTAQTDASVQLPAKKKRSHGKTRPPGHIPRPPNAFIIFRTEYIKSMATQNSTPEVSKSLGERWRMMTPSEKQPWKEKAEEAKIQHQLDNPGYKYKPVHPRDEFGNCIRKPRKPNRPREKKTPLSDGLLEHLPSSFQWLEGKRDTEFSNVALPSDASSASSPPPSPSPAPSFAAPQPRALYQTYRRSSSVPLPGPDESFYGAAETGFAFPAPPMGHHNAGYGSRRLSKRPSTSMDFACAGPNHQDLYSLNNEMYLSPNDASQWRLGHRRSISAPDLGGEIPAAQFTYAPSHSFAQEANTLTPINPVFGNVFDRFSWSDTSNTHYTPADYSGLQPPLQQFTNSGHRQQEYITVEIPSMASSPNSNLSSATSPPTSTPGVSPSPHVYTPAIQHPAPVATFDFTAFQAQMSEFDAVGFDHAPRSDASFESNTQEGFNDALGFVSQAGDGGTDRLLSTDATDIQGEQFYSGQCSAGGGAQPHNLDGKLPTASSDLQGYDEGVQYTHTEIVLPRPLDFNELIVEGY